MITTIWEKMVLQGKVTPLQAKKRRKKTAAATWPWFVLMDKVLGQRPSINPPSLIASIPEDTSGPGTAVGDQEEEEEEEQESQPGSGKKKREKEYELIGLIKEDMRLQREAEDRRERESSGEDGPTVVRKIN